MQTVIAIIAAYLLGSVSFAVLVSKLMRLPDPRSYCSKNPGAPNVRPTGSKLAGVLLALDWRIGVGTIATWLIIALFLRYSSLAALVAAVFAPLATAFLLGWQSALWVAVISAFLVWRHKANISRLLAGTEPRLGAKKTTPSGPS